LGAGVLRLKKRVMGMWEAGTNAVLTLCYPLVGCLLIIG
jgi:hypothetical protein